MSIILFEINIRVNNFLGKWIIAEAICVENRLNFFIREIILVIPEIILVILEIKRFIREYNLDYRGYISRSLSGVYKPQQCPYPEHSLLRNTPPLLL